MSKQLSPSTEIQMLLEMSRNFIGKSENHETRIQTIEKHMTVDSRTALNIRSRALKHVAKTLGGRDSETYKSQYRQTISHLWHDFWQAFGVCSYRDTPTAMYDQAISWIDKWRPIQLVGLEEAN